MNGPSLADILALWRHLLRLPPERWQGAAQLALERCQNARCYLRVTGQVHPHLGDGSLASLCQRGPLAPIPCRLDAGALGALSAALAALQPDAQEMQRIQTR